jgi:hypothetical protein
VTSDGRDGERTYLPPRERSRARSEARGYVASSRVEAIFVSKTHPSFKKGRGEGGGHSQEDDEGPAPHDPIDITKLSKIVSDRALLSHRRDVHDMETQPGVRGQLYPQVVLSAPVSIL